MHTNHNRTIKISKSKLIEKISENKEAHIKDFNEAVIAYKVEAQKQLEIAQKELNDGSLKIKLNLVTPVNRAEEYDKVIEMFKWEIDDEIQITQREFNEYVHDDTEDAKMSRMLNSTYK